MCLFTLFYYIIFVICHEILHIVKYVGFRTVIRLFILYNISLIFSLLKKYFAPKLSMEIELRRKNVFEMKINCELKSLI